MNPGFSQCEQAHRFGSRNGEPPKPVAIAEVGALSARDPRRGPGRIRAEVAGEGEDLVLIQRPIEEAEFIDRSLERSVPASGTTDVQCVLCVQGLASPRRFAGKDSVDVQCKAPGGALPDQRNVVPGAVVESRRGGNESFRVTQPGLASS